jgi:hypothetical protein
MQSKATTVKQYLNSLPEDRREAIEAVRAAVNAGLPIGYREGIQYGMIGWFVPHSLYEKGYHCDPKLGVPFAALASQKNHMSLYLHCIYGSEAHRKQFEKDCAKAGKKLDMGKSCVRFKSLDDLPLEVVSAAVSRVPVAKFIAAYESALAGPSSQPAAKKKVVKKRAKKAAQKKVAKKSAKKVAKKTAEKAAKKVTKKKAAKKTAKKATARKGPAAKRVVKKTAGRRTAKTVAKKVAKKKAAKKAAKKTTARKGPAAQRVVKKSAGRRTAKAVAKKVAKKTAAKKTTARKRTTKRAPRRR